MWMCRLAVSKITSCRCYGASQTLLSLLDKITNEGRRLGAISDMNISDMSANAPVGTTLALLERTLKPMAAVQSRVHYAMKQEFKLLKAIMAQYAPAEYGYPANRGEVSAREADYMLVDVIPSVTPIALQWRKESFNTKRYYRWHNLPHRYIIFRSYTGR